MNKIINKIIITFIILIVSIIFAIQSSTSSFSSFDNYFYDHFFWIRGEIDPGDKVVVVGITEECFEALEKYYPFDYKIFADTIMNIKNDGAKVIGLDFLITDPFTEETTENDLLLKSAFEHGNKVICASILEKIITREKINGEVFRRTTDLILKPHSFYKNSYIPGLINKQTSLSHGLRFHKPVRYLKNGEKELSLVSKCILKYMNIPDEELENNLEIKNNSIMFAGKEIPSDSEGRFAVNFTGAAGNRTVIPFYVANMKYFPPDTFRDKIVLIGPYFKESKDFFYTPFTGSQFCSGNLSPGVELMAEAIDTVVNNRNIKIIELKQSLIISVFLILIMSYISINSGLLTVIISLLILLSLSIIFPAYEFVYNNTYYNPVIFISSILFSSISGTIIRASVFEKKSRKILSTFSRYVTKDIAEVMIKEDVKLPLEGKKMDVAIIFGDIRGFTSYAGNSSPDKVFRELNSIFEIIIEEVFNNGGTLDKFLGDGVMIIFGAPVEMKNKELKAIDTIKKITQRIYEFNEKRIKNDEEILTMGFGITTGTALVGNIGSSIRMEYTAIGNIVNMASRLQNFASGYETILSEEIYEKIKDNTGVLESRTVDVKGMEEKVKIRILPFDHV